MMIQTSILPIQDCFEWNADKQEGKCRSGKIYSFQLTFFKKVSICFSFTLWSFHE